MKIFTPIAACAIIAIAVAIPAFFRNDFPSDTHGNEPHFAYVYDYLDIFFVTEQDTIISESVFRTPAAKKNLDISQIMQL